MSVCINYVYLNAFYFQVYFVSYSIFAPVLLEYLFNFFPSLCSPEILIRLSHSIDLLQALWYFPLLSLCFVRELFFRWVFTYTILILYWILISMIFLVSRNYIWLFYILLYVLMCSPNFSHFYFFILIKYTSLKMYIHYLQSLQGLFMLFYMSSLILSCFFISLWFKNLSARFL